MRVEDHCHYAVGAADLGNRFSDSHTGTYAFIEVVTDCCYDFESVGMMWFLLLELIGLL